jgi:formylglycine-generating enzyme
MTAMEFLRTNVAVNVAAAVSFLCSAAAGTATSPLDRESASTKAASSPTDAGRNAPRDPGAEEETLTGACADLCDLERDRKKRLVGPAIESFIRQHKDDKGLDRNTNQPIVSVARSWLRDMKQTVIDFEGCDWSRSHCRQGDFGVWGTLPRGFQVLDGEGGLGVHPLFSVVHIDSHGRLAEFPVEHYRRDYMFPQMELFLYDFDGDGDPEVFYRSTFKAEEWDPPSYSMLLTFNRGKVVPFGPYRTHAWLAEAEVRMEDVTGDSRPDLLAERKLGKLTDLASGFEYDARSPVFLFESLPSGQFSATTSNAQKAALKWCPEQPPLNQIGHIGHVVCARIRGGAVADLRARLRRRGYRKSEPLGESSAYGSHKSYFEAMLRAASLQYPTALTEASIPTTPKGVTGRVSPELPGVEWIYSERAGVELTKTEVTKGQFNQCVTMGLCQESNRWTKSYNERCNSGHFGRGDHPMNCVKWEGAEEFCKWIGGRLPTEDEWYAEASNGGDRTRPWGAGPEASCDYAVVDIGTGACGGEDGTRPVCSKHKGDSVSGLCDMIGNAWEMTSSSRNRARVLRGGSWIDHGSRLGAAYRLWESPNAWDDSVGFRCARAREAR